MKKANVILIIVIAAIIAVVAFEMLKPKENEEETVSSNSVQEVQTISARIETNRMAINDEEKLKDYNAVGNEYSMEAEDEVPQDPNWVTKSYLFLVGHSPEIMGKKIETVERYHIEHTTNNYVYYKINGIQYVLYEQEINGSTEYNLYTISTDTSFKEGDEFIKQNGIRIDSANDVEQAINAINEGTFMSGQNTE